MDCSCDVPLLSRQYSNQVLKPVFIFPRCFVFSQWVLVGKGSLVVTGAELVGVERYSMVL
jgi:hypothetical protein